MAQEFRFIDVCAGIGGLRLPFEELGGACVFTSEIDAAARFTYSANFAKVGIATHGEIDTDIMRIGSTEPGAIPAHDLLLAGFPCQPFSHAGKKRGFDDIRGTIFFAIAEVIRAKRPRVVLLENVRGLKAHDKGHTLSRILSVLRDELGYYVPEPRILNARDFGLPQNRQRLFIVAIRDDISDAQTFCWPTPTHEREELRVADFLERDPDPVFTISDSLWRGHVARKQRNREAGKGWGYQIFEGASTYVATISARYYKDGSEALIAQTDGQNPRKLTPREVARLQGFPEDFILHPSRMQAYKQLGNAVPINVIRALADSCRRFLVS